MWQRVARVFCWACLWMSAIAPTQAGAEQNSPSRDPRFLLENIRQRLDAVSNYRCTVAMGSTEKRFAYDWQGRDCTRERPDDLGTIRTIWDGTQTIELREHTKPSGELVYSASIVAVRRLTSHHGELPWHYLGSSLVGPLAQGRQIALAPTEDGHCYLEVPFGTAMTLAVILDPKRGYVPIRQDRIYQGKRSQAETIEFVEVEPGVWFPSAVWTQHAHVPASSRPRIRFTDVTINDPNFDRVLAPDVPDGSTVADEIRGVRYVVDHRRGLTLTGQTSPHADAVAAEASESMYRLAPNHALKRIAPVCPADRRRFMGGGDAGSDPMPEAAMYNAVYVFEWDDAGTPKVTYTGAGFLNLSEILHYVCGLEIAQYSGSEELLNLRLAGDWIVGRGASVANCLRALEPIVYEQTGVRINFEKQRVDAPVVRATGIFQYHPLPGTRRENDVQLFGERSVNEDRTYVGGGSGTLAQLLRHITNRTGRRFIDDTLSSEMNVSWSDYSSSELDPIGDVQQIYRFDLARLLEHVAMQTGLRFETERRTIDEWHLSIKP